MNAKLKELPQVPRSNQFQRKYLEERLYKAAQAKRGPEDRKPPPNIVAAQKLIRRWEHEGYAAASKARQRVSSARAVVREKILFGTPEEALAAVQRFEKLSLV